MYRPRPGVASIRKLDFLIPDSAFEKRGHACQGNNLYCKGNPQVPQKFSFALYILCLWPLM